MPEAGDGAAVPPLAAGEDAVPNGAVSGQGRGSKGSRLKSTTISARALGAGISGRAARAEPRKNNVDLDLSKKLPFHDLYVGDVISLRDGIYKEAAFLWSDALARDVAFYTTTRSQESPPDFGQCLWRICPELDYSAAEKLTATTLKIRGLAAAGAAKGRFAGTSTWGGRAITCVSRPPQSPFSRPSKRDGNTPRE